MEDKFLTVYEIAELLKVDQQTVRMCELQLMRRATRSLWERMEGIIATCAA